MGGQVRAGIEEVRQSIRGKVHTSFNEMTNRAGDRILGELRAVAESIVVSGIEPSYVAFPALEVVMAPIPIHHVTSTALLRLSNGTLWMLKSSGSVWTAGRLNQAARVLGQFAEADRNMALEMRLRGTLGVQSIRLVPPTLLEQVAQRWDVREVAGALVLRQFQLQGARDRKACDLELRIDALAGRLVACLEQAIARVVAKMDQAAATLATSESFDQGAYNYFVVPETRRNRMQFAATMPLLLDEVIADPSDAQLGELREMVDLGRPLLKEMSRILMVRPFVVRRLVGLPVKTVGRRWHRRSRELVRLLDQLAPHELPTADQASWARLEAACEQAEKLLRRPAWSGGLMLSFIRHSLLNAKVPAESSGQISTINLDALAAVESFRDNLIDAAVAETGGLEDTPVGAAQAGATAAVDRYIESNTLRRLISLSVRWKHAAAGALTSLNAEVDLLARRRYPSPLRVEFVSSNGQRRIVAITTLQQLRAHGQAMKNCLGGAHLMTYDERIKKGESFVLACLDTHTGNPVSTAEVRCARHNARGQVELRIGQHTATRNAAPDVECLVAVRELLEAMTHGGMQMDLRTWSAQSECLQRSSFNQGIDASTLAKVSAFRQTLGAERYESIVAGASSPGPVSCQLELWTDLSEPPLVHAGFPELGSDRLDRGATRSQACLQVSAQLADLVALLESVRDPSRQA